LPASRLGRNRGVDRLRLLDGRSAQADRSHVTKATAEMLRQRMSHCRVLLYVASGALQYSKWMPSYRCRQQAQHAGVRDVRRAGLDRSLCAKRRSCWVNGSGRVRRGTGRAGRCGGARRGVVGDTPVGGVVGFREPDSVLGPGEEGGEPADIRPTGHSQDRCERSKPSTNCPTLRRWRPAWSQSASAATRLAAWPRALTARPMTATSPRSTAMKRAGTTSNPASGAGPARHPARLCARCRRSGRRRRGRCHY